MDTALKVVALILLAIGFVAAYYTGKAELTVSQMFKQPEIKWGYWGSYICWLVSDFFGPDYSVIYILVRLLVYLGIAVLLVIVQTVGLRRKQMRRDE